MVRHFLKLSETKFLEGDTERRSAAYYRYVSIRAQDRRTKNLFMRSF